MAKSKQNIETVTPGLDIDESIDLQEKGFVIQRIGWILMALFIFLAAAGLFGNGILSKKYITSGEQKLEYPKFSRFESRMELKFDLVAGPQGNIISFPNNYLEKFRVESILPEPRENQVSNDRVNYIFEGTGPMKISFYLVPQSFGNMNAGVLVNNQQFNFTQFIYP